MKLRLLLPLTLVVLLMSVFGFVACEKQRLPDEAASPPPRALSAEPALPQVPPTRESEEDREGPDAEEPPEEDMEGLPPELFEEMPEAFPPEEGETDTGIREV